MNTNERVAAHRYLTPQADAFWEWRDGGEVITWRSGATIAFRPEVVAVLERLAPRGLPWFDAVVLFFAACRAHDNISKIVLENLDYRSTPLTGKEEPCRWFPDVLRALEAVHAVPFKLRDTRERKADLAEMVFEAAPPTELPATAAVIVRGLGEWRPDIDVDLETRRGPEHLTRLVQLAAGADRISAERLALRQKTGLEMLPEAVPVEATPHESLREFLGRLEKDEELGGFARLAKNLLATLTLPRPVSDSNDLPLGGVSDISNRGPLDRLLLSELAQDDLTFTARVALGEALYLRREAPPHVPPQRRVVLVDCGLRMWGLPRVFATAAAMALAVPRRKQAETLVYRPRGPHLDVVDLGTREGLVAQLAALEPEADPAEALPVLARVALEEGDAGEAVLITCDEVLADKTFRRALAACALPLLYVVAVTRAGRLQLTRRTPQGSKLLKEIHCELNDLLVPRPAVAPLIDSSRDPSWPTILRFDPFPLRLPHPVDPGRLWGDVDSGILCLTTDRRLMLWDKRGRGARQLLDTLPSGRLHWVDSGVAASPVRSAVIGKLQQGELYLLHAELDLGRCRVTRLPLLHVNPRGIAAHAGALYVIFNSHVEVFSSEGQWLESRSLQPEMTWVHGRFFTSPDGVYALSFNGSNAAFEHVCQARICPGSDLIGMFDMVGIDGPLGVTAHGTIGPVRAREEALLGSRTSSKSVVAPVVISGPSEPAKDSDALPFFPRKLMGAPFRREAASADSQRIVLSPFPDPREQRPKWILDLRKGTARQMSHTTPAIMIASDLLGAIANRTLRHRFATIFVDRAGNLTLQASSGRSHCHIAYDSVRRRIVLVTQAPTESRGRYVTFVESPSPPGTGYRLSVAIWRDGSRAYLDSRGLLHLKSADATIPELTLVLQEGTVAGWCADRGLFGPDYFTGTESVAEAADVYREVLCRFLDHLS
jgi:hypothetical protein